MKVLYKREKEKNGVRRKPSRKNSLRFKIAIISSNTLMKRFRVPRCTIKKGYLNTLSNTSVTYKKKEDALRSVTCLLKEPSYSYTDHILKIIEETCLKIEIGGKVKDLLGHDVRVLQESFHPTDAQYIFNSLTYYGNVMSDDCHVTVAGYKVDADVSVALRMLTENPAIRNYVLKNPCTCSEFSRGLIKNILALTKQILHSNVPRENNILMEFVNLIQAEVYQRQASDIAKLNEKIRKQEEKMEAYRRERQEALNRLKDESEKQLFQIEQKRIKVNSEFKANVTAIKYELEQIREKHMVIEDTKHQHCLNLATELAQWIGKHDSLTATRNKTSRQLKQELDEFRELNARYVYLLNGQRPIYNQYKREYYIYQVFERCKRTIAAAQIQNWWRRLKLVPKIEELRLKLMQLLVD